MIKWWHQNNWGKAACGRRTRALKCWRSCACKPSKLLVLEICFIVCNLSSNNFLRSLAEEAILICFNLLLQLSSINRTVTLCKHSIRTFNANTQFQHSNLQCKHSTQTFNPNIQCEYPIRTFTANIQCSRGSVIWCRNYGARTRLSAKAPSSIQWSKNVAVVNWVWDSENGLHGGF